MMRAIILTAGFVALWQGVIWATGVRPFMLPPPAAVAEALD